MSTRLKLLEWDWWFSYGPNNRLELDENNVTQILGTNGNGKSSIYLIIEELLYNKNSKGIKKADIPNRHGPGGYWGRLTFQKDEDEYKIEVDRKGSLKVKLFKNDSDISSHTATDTFKNIEQLLGNDFKTASQLINQSPHSSLQFLTATDTNRKKFFIDLLQLEVYVTAFEVFKSAVKDHADAVLGIEGQLKTVERWLQSNKLEDTTTKEPKPLTIDPFDDERKAAGLTSEIQNINHTNRQIAKNNQYRELYEAINIEEIQAIECDEPQSYDEHQTDLGGLQSSLSSHQRQLKKLEGLGNQCPTCEQTIDEDFKSNLIAEEQANIESIQGRIQQLVDLISFIKSNNLRHKQKHEKIKEWEELFRSVDHKLPRELINKQDLESELSNLTIKISNARSELKKITAHNEDVARHNARIQMILQQAKQYETELEELNSKLKEQQAILSDLETLKKSFSTNGLIAYKIENQVKDLEDETNKYLAEFSDGRFNIEFSVSNDKLNVNIYDDGTQIDILSLSSGQLARVNTSTLLGIRKLMNSISKSEINVLFIDDVIQVLDPAGKEKLVEVLLKEKLNTYIISQDWSHPLLAKIEIVIDGDGLSKVET